MTDVRQDLIMAARQRWRADLLDFGAGLIAPFDAAGATAKQSEAEMFRLHADLLEAHGEAKDAYAAAKAAAIGKASADDLRAIAAGTKLTVDLPGVRDALGSLRDARGALVEARQYWRLVDGFTGKRGRDSLVNNFAEPSDAELVASYGLGGS